MDRARYEDYVAAFNGKDYDRLASYYAEDVEFILSEERGLVFHGRQAILDLYKLVDLTIGLRVTQEEEREGLDIADHGERAYNY